MPYEPRFDLDLQRGEAAEHELAAMLTRAGGTTVECKRDDQALNTGNAYVEYEQSPNGEWKPSGVATSEAEWWAHKVGEVWVVAPTENWRWVARTLFKSHRKTTSRGDNPTRGVAIPLTDLLDLLNEAPF